MNGKISEEPQESDADIAETDRAREKPWTFKEIRAWLEEFFIRNPWARVPVSADDSAEPAEENEALAKGPYRVIEVEWDESRSY